MAVYSIKDLEKLSGIKAHTIRIWEQRYGLLCPKRTQTNIRYYLDDDLKFLLNVALLNKNGYRISKIAEMQREEIREKVKEISEDNFGQETQLDTLTISMIEMDEYKFDKVVQTSIDEKGFEDTMLEVINPFLEKLGLLWLTGSVKPAQENFISNLIRQKLISALDSLPLTQYPNQRKFIIFTPESEPQELSLLFIHYLLKSRGQKVIYLGQNIFPLDAKAAYDIHKPDFVFMLLTESIPKFPTPNLLAQVKAIFSESQVLLSGYEVISKASLIPRNATILNGLDDTISFLETV